MAVEHPPKFASRRPDWQPRNFDLDQLQLHPFDVLEQASNRQPCPKCQKSRFLYCYDCAVPFTAIPQLQLPFQVSIITHHAELASKNTGVHAAILCPEQVQLHSVDHLPECDPSRCVVMFPSDDAVLPDKLDVQQLQRVIIIDSKWAKAKELNEHRAFNGMKRVKLPGTPKSCFWRFHTSGVSDEGVCTIEALHLLMQAMAERLEEPAQREPHYFDNLLWYFAFQHQLVAKKAAERQQKKQQELQQHRGHEQAAEQQQQHNGHQQTAGQQQQQRIYPLQPSKKKRKQQQQQQQLHGAAKLIKQCQQAQCCQQQPHVVDITQQRQVLLKSEQLPAVVPALHQQQERDRAEAVLVVEHKEVLNAGTVQECKDQEQR